MKILIIGYILTLFTLSYAEIFRDKDFTVLNPDLILQQTEEKFRLRDYFKEKGNSGRFLNTNRP
jgi:hypothetical protein